MKLGSHEGSIIEGPLALSSASYVMYHIMLILHVVSYRLDYSSTDFYRLCLENQLLRLAGKAEGHSLLQLSESSARVDLVCIGLLFLLETMQSTAEGECLWAAIPS